MGISTKDSVQRWSRGVMTRREPQLSLSCLGSAGWVLGLWRTEPFDPLKGRMPRATYCRVQWGDLAPWKGGIPKTLQATRETAETAMAHPCVHVRGPFLSYPKWEAPFTRYVWRINATCLAGVLNWHLYSIVALQWWAPDKLVLSKLSLCVKEHETL